MDGVGFGFNITWLGVASKLRNAATMFSHLKVFVHFTGKLPKIIDFMQ
jgi:hypothetical protein